MVTIGNDALRQHKATRERRCRSTAATSIVRSRRRQPTATLSTSPMALLHACSVTDHVGHSSLPTRAAVTVHCPRARSTRPTPKARATR